MSRFQEDIRFAARTLRRSPAFAAVAIITLALGIGANTAIFSVVNSVLLRPLPYDGANRLVRIYTEFPRMGLRHFWMSPPEYIELSRDSKTFAAVGAWNPGSVNVGSPAGPLRVTSSLASRKLFDTMGVRPAMGRNFTAEEDLKDGPLSVIISDGLWRRAFGGRADIVGQSILVDGRALPVAGVLPRDFAFPPGDAQPIDLWLPMQLTAQPDDTQRGSHGLWIVGRLAPGATIEQARAEMAHLMGGWAKQNRHSLNAERHPLVLLPLHEDVVGAVRPAVLLLMGAVGFVLLIACVNVGNLLLARAEVRQREIALRAALGAGVGRLLALFFAEGLLLALPGAVLGTLLAHVAVRVLVAAYPDGVPRAAEIGIDTGVLLFTLAISILAALIFAAAPVLHVRHEQLAERLREGGQRSTSHAGGKRLRNVLVTTEIALAVVLVIGSGLTVKGFWKLLSVDPGFDARNVLTMEFALPQATYPKPEDVQGFWQRAQQRVGAIPGVEATTIAVGIPPEELHVANDTDFEGYHPGPNDPPANVDYYQVTTASFFRTLGTKFASGRGFEPGDEAPTAMPAAVVNEALARRFWPGQNPIGRRLRPGIPDSVWYTVVGVAKDVHNAGLSQPAGPELFLLHEHAMRTSFGPERQGILIARTRVEPLTVATSARRVIQELDPQIPVARVRSMDQVIRTSLARPRFLAMLMSIFSGVALLLAAVGIYGVVAYSVAQQRQEIGVRMALGAPRSAVFRMVLGQGMRLAGTGILAGVLLALVVTKVLSGLLYEVSATDPATFALVAVVLAAVTLLASAVPAESATRVDPMVALRSE